MEPSDQVSGYGKSLLEAINEGVVPKPRLMKWNAWQTWRTDHGRRPTMAKDGRSTHNADEFKLFKATMRALYGDDVDWRIEQLQDDGERPAGGAPGAAAGGTS